VVAGAGFDWMLLDMEHSANDLPQIVDQLRAAKAAPPSLSCGCPGTRRSWYKRVLDQGARSLLFPFVQSAEEARRAVAATRYPPDGIRGVPGGLARHAVRPHPDYFKRAAAELCVIARSRPARRSLPSRRSRRSRRRRRVHRARRLSADFGHPNNWHGPRSGRDHRRRTENPAAGKWQASCPRGRRIAAKVSAPGLFVARPAAMARHPGRHSERSSSCTKRPAPLSK